MIEIMTPTGTINAIASARPGTKINSTAMTKIGATAIFQFRLIITTAIPPNNEGRIFSKAGANTGDSSKGLIQNSKNTPTVRSNVVTSELTAMEIVEISSPSFVPGSTFARFIAFIAQGTLRLIRLPVIKPR